MSPQPENNTSAVSPATAYALAVTCMLIWGSPPVVSRSVSADIPPLALTFGRWFVSALILAPFVWPRLRREWPKLRENFRSLLRVSAYMIAGSSLSVIAVYFTTATNAVLVNASQPAITALIAWLVGSERLSLRQGAGIGLAFFGILVMMSRADIAVLASFDISIGDLIMLAAVVGWSLYAVQLHRQPYVPKGDVLLFFISAFGSVVLFPLYLVEAFLAGPFDMSFGVGSAIIYLAIFPTLLATNFWNLALRSIGANRSAIFINLIPVFGTAFAMIFLGERLFAYHLIGAALVFTGIYFAVYRRNSARSEGVGEDPG